MNTGSRGFLYKKQICALFLILAILLCCVSCGGNGGVPDGIYSCVAADTGEVYTFSGREVSVTLFIMGNPMVQYSGTYRIDGDVITLNFPKDIDKIYSGAYSFSLSEDGLSLVIGGTTFTRESSLDTTESAQ